MPVWPAAAGVENAWRAWRASEDALAAAQAQIVQASADQDLLLAHLAELTALAPEAGEEVALAEARATMQKGERLSGDLAELKEKIHEQLAIFGKIPATLQTRRSR